jgi:hypothetical protein
VTRSERPLDRTRPGGPNYVGIGGRLVLAATTITGDIPCYATNVVYRTDTASARNFLKAYVALP